MQTDYLIIGSGAAGMAFADTLLDESDAHITIVDRRDKPGGHWNDAYSFVTLHQPSAYYGVNSVELGRQRKDESGPNKGMYELAGGAEINTYFEQVMHQKFLPSGRVSYYPMSEYAGDGRIVSLLSGAQTTITIRRKTVDATCFSPTVPSTHTPNFSVAEGVRVIAPNDLPRLWLQPPDQPIPRRFCILGAGKTAMDTAIWLLRNGAPADAIQWVMPRDSWLQNRLHAQPGMENFSHSIGGEADRMAAFAEAKSIDEVFLKLESLGQMLRIDPTVRPTMFHYAIISTGEIDLLRQIKHVIRKGRVQRIDRDSLSLDQATLAMAPDTVYVDCTASALNGRAAEPVFQQNRIAIQLLRAPLITFSAALIAYVEAHGTDDIDKNQLCAPLPLPVELKDFAHTTLMGMSNQFRWSQDKALRQWIRASRLDAFSKLVAEVDKDDVERQAIIGRLRASVPAAMTNMPRLLKPISD